MPGGQSTSTSEVFTNPVLGSMGHGSEPRAFGTKSLKICSANDVSPGENEIIFHCFVFLMLMVVVWGWGVDEMGFMCEWVRGGGG